MLRPIESTESLGYMRKLVVVLFVSFLSLSFIRSYLIPSPQGFKPIIEKKFLQQTGLLLDLKGLSWSLLPLGVMAEKATLRHPREQDSLIEAHEIFLQIDWVKLFKRQVKLKAINIFTLSIHVKKDQAGKFNFNQAYHQPPNTTSKVTLVEAKAVPKLLSAQIAALSTPRMSLQTLQLKRAKQQSLQIFPFDLHLNNVNFHYKDEKNSKHIDLVGLSLAIKQLKLDKPNHVSLVLYTYQTKNSQLLRSNFDGIVGVDIPHQGITIKELQYRQVSTKHGPDHVFYLGAPLLQLHIGWPKEKHQVYAIALDLKDAIVGNLPIGKAHYTGKIKAHLSAVSKQIEPKSLIRTLNAKIDVDLKDGWLVGIKRKQLSNFLQIDAPQFHLHTLTIAALKLKTSILNGKLQTELNAVTDLFQLASAGSIDWKKRTINFDIHAHQQKNIIAWRTIAPKHYPEN